MANNTSRNLWISPLTICSVKAYQITLGKLPNLNFDLRLANGLPIVRLSPLLRRLDVLNLITVPVTSMWLMTLFVLLTKQDPYTTKQIVQIMVLIAGISMLVFSSLIRRVFQKDIQLVAQINSLFQSNPTIRSKQITNSRTIPNTDFDLPGTLMFLVIMDFDFLGLPGGMLISYIGVDPFAATYEQIFNLHLNLVTFFLNSIFNTFLLVFIFMRELFILGFVGIILFVRIKAELDALHSYSLSESQFVCTRYNLLQRQYLRIANSSALIMVYLIVNSQIVTCTFAWMVCICWKLIPPYLVMTFLSGAILTLGSVLFVLQTQSTCRASSETLIRKHLNGFHVYGIRGGSNGYWKRMWKCQRPLRISCGEQFAIDRDAYMNYLDVLSDNLTNVLVLVKI